MSNEATGTYIDNALVESAWSEHYHRLFNYAKRHLPTVEDAEDAVKETFLRFYKYTGKIRDVRKLLNWLAKCVIADFYIHRPPTAVSLDEVDEDDNSGSGFSKYWTAKDQESDPYRMLLEAERLEIVNRVMQAKFTKRKRQIVKMRFEGYEFDDIGDVVGMDRDDVANEYKGLSGVLNFNVRNNNSSTVEQE
jgi:RNA polymerase sigma factor (sigma-70 family)